MQKNEETIIMKYPIEKVYKFLKDANNYLSGISGVKVESSGQSASFSIPGFGNVKANITNLVENKKVVIYSKDINTSLEAHLEEKDSNNTKIRFVSLSNPNCGFFKNLMITAAIPRVLKSISENLKTQKIL